MTLAAHAVTLAAHAVTLAAHAVTLAAHAVTLAACAVTLAACAVTLAACAVTLPACAATLAAHAESFAAHALTLAAYALTLLAYALKYRFGVKRIFGLAGKRLAVLKNIFAGDNRRDNPFNTISKGQKSIGRASATVTAQSKMRSKNVNVKILTYYCLTIVSRSLFYFFSMRKAKLIEDNSKLTHDAVSPFAHSVVNQTSSSSFLLKGPDLVKPLGLTLVAYDTDVTTVNYPTPAQTAFRDQLRTAVTLELNRLAKRLNLDYPGNEPALLSSGLTMGSMSGTAARPTANLGAPTEVELLDGATAGCLLLRLKRPLGAVQNLIRYSTDAALSEDQWHVVVGGGREREFGTFASGTRVYVKVACLTGSTTVPDYSAVLSRIVQ